MSTLIGPHRILCVTVQRRSSRWNHQKHPSIRNG